jgi:hypothetical protein
MSELPSTHTGIGSLEINEDDDKEEERIDNNIETGSSKIGEIKVPMVTSQTTSSHSIYNIRDMLDKHRKPDQWLDSKVYTRNLLPDEFVVKEALVWKRAGWSFKHRWLVLTNKPRLFYTTTAGHYKGMIPWSMTEPIEIEMKDKTHFDISVHSISRVYHFNDKTDGSEHWVEIINEVTTITQQIVTANQQ